MRRLRAHPDTLSRMKLAGDDLVVTEDGTLLYRGDALSDHQGLPNDGSLWEEVNPHAEGSGTVVRLPGTLVPRRDVWLRRIDR